MLSANCKSVTKKGGYFESLGMVHTHTFSLLVGHRFSPRRHAPKSLPENCCFLHIKYRSELLYPRVPPFVCTNPKRLTRSTPVVPELTYKVILKTCKPLNGKSGVCMTLVLAKNTSVLARLNGRPKNPPRAPIELLAPRRLHSPDDSVSLSVC